MTCERDDSRRYLYNDNILETASSMTSILTYERILEHFDGLVEQGIIFHHPSRVVEYEDRGYKVSDPTRSMSFSELQLTAFEFGFEVTASLAGKSAAEVAIRVPEHTPDHLLPSRPQTFGPGSDITNAHPDLLVTTINDTHLVVINKFCVFRPQLLLLTADSYQRQHTPLSVDDFAAALSVLEQTGDHFYVMFNCGERAGASRHHKHIQVLPHPDSLSSKHDRWRLFPDYEPPLDTDQVPFVHFIERFDKYALSPDNLLSIYLTFVEKSRGLLKINDSTQPCPHNFVLTSRWLMVIPRARIDVEGITANSAGMMGSVWLKDTDQMNAWIDYGPARALSQLGLESVDSRP